MKHKLILLFALVFAAGTGLVSAQETTTGSLSGAVVDSQGAPIPGAAVTITSEQGPKSLVTDNAGRFFAPYLTPGRYAVKVELTGFNSIEQKNIELRLGQRLELKALVLKVGAITETLEVVGTAPVIDTSSTTVGGTLDSETLKRLPVGRNFTDTLYLVPGVSDSGGVGKANPSVSGSSGLENNYVVDGVNITNAGYGGVGSYSIIFGSLGSGVTTDFIKETQVKTGGFEAEYGQSTGGVINVVTQSGTNSFRGSVFGYFRPNSLESNWKQLRSPNGTVNTTATDNYDFGLTLGAPIVKNKLFFFGAFNPQYQKRTFVAPAGFPLASRGDIDRKRRVLSYAGKLTWQPSGNHRFDISAFGDPAKGDNGPQRFTSLIQSTTSSFSEVSYGGHNQVLRYDGILTRNWLVEASVAHAKNTISEIPSVNEWNVSDRTVVPFVTTGGVGFYEKGNEGKNLQYQLKSTHIFNAGGNHQLRYGAAYEDINYNNINQRTGPTFTLPDGTKTATGAQIQVLPDPAFGRVYRVVRANLNSGRETTQQYLSFFLQDTWQIGKKLTLRPGVRYEQQKLVGSDSPALCRVGDSVPGAGDGPGAPVACEYKWDGNYGPRLGATFDVKGDGKSKIFASWGRFFAKIPNDLAARAMSADAGVTRADYFDAGLTRPIPNGTLAAGVTTHQLLAGLHASTFAPNSKSTYQDEFLGGFEVAVARNVNLGVRYIHRTLPSILEDYQPAPVVAFDLGCPGADTVEYFIDNISPSLARFRCAGVPDASFENPEHTYDSVEFTGNKTFSNNWAMVASYRWSRLKGLFEGFYRNDNGQSDPAITSLFDFPTNDPSFTQIGAPRFGYRGDIRFQGCSLGCGTLPNDRTHQLKLYANRAWGSFNAGLGFNAGSGRPLTNLAAQPNYQNSGEIPLTLRGGGINTVDGQKKRSPAEVAFDLHADYTIKLAGDRRILLLADAFNLFNRTTATNYDNCSDSGFGSSNPNFGQPTNGCVSRGASFQDPRAIRLGARFEW